MINIHIYPTRFSNNSSRVIKEVESIISTTPVSSVTVIAKHEQGQALEERLSENINVIRVKSIIKVANKNIFFEIFKYLEYLIRAIFLLRKSKVQYVNIHSLHVLPIGVILKILKRCQLIYDPHELETEVAGAAGFKQKVAKILERKFIPFADKTIVVSESIRDWYIDEYGLKPEDTYTIRNIPIGRSEKIENSDLFRSEFSIPKESMIFLYQGNISKVRGCDTILKLFESLDNDRHIVFMGNGDGFVEVIKSASATHSNIHYKEAVPYSDIAKYTGSADMGLHFIKVGDILNHKYCMPNKLFEYLLFGLPVIVNSKAVEMLKVVTEFEVGIGLDADTFDEKEAISLISSLSQEQVSKFRSNLEKVRTTFDWRNDAKAYQDIYI